MQFKGLQEPVTLYDVVGLQGKYACALPQQEPEHLITLASPLAVACYPVDGKTVSEQAVSGTITRLAESSAEVSLEDEVTLYSNMRLQLESPDGPTLSEVYAKVVALNREGETTAASDVCLGFTSLPEDVKAFLERQRAGTHQTV